MLHLGCFVQQTGTTGTGGGTTTVNFPQPDIIGYQSRNAYPTYDGSNPGKIFRFALELIAANTETAITYSTSALRRSGDDTFTIGAGSTTFQRILSDQSRIILGAGNDSQLILNPGNNTAFNQNFEFVSPVSGVIDQLALSFAIGMNMSAFTNGSATISSVTVTPQSYISRTGSGGSSAPLQTIQPQTLTLSPTSAFTALSSAGTTQIYVIRHAYNSTQPFPVSAGQPFTINITVNTAISGTNTVQVGLLPLFSGILADSTKEWYTPEIIASIRTLPENLDAIASTSQIKMQGVNT